MDFCTDAGVAERAEPAGLGFAVPAADHGEWFRRILEAQSELISLADLAGGLLYVNDAYARHFGRTASGMIGRNLLDFVAPADHIRVRAHLRRVAASNREAVDENRMIGADGRIRWVEWTNRALADSDGRAIAVLSVGRDKTDRKLAEQALAQQHELLVLTLRSIGDGVIATDAAQTVTFLNPVAERLTGWTAQQAAGEKLDRVFVTRCDGDGKPVMLVGRTGAECEIEATLAPIMDHATHRHGAIAVFRDVTEQRRLVREATYRALHDPLTGLANRAQFDRQLAAALDAARAGVAGALLLVDLDRFKIVNDEAGHAIGDQLLQQVAQTLRTAVRPADTVARLGGDEFAVVLAAPQAEAEAVAERICERIRLLRIAQGRRSFQIGASIGLVGIDSRWDDPAALQQAADAACYAAKAAGRGRVYVHSDVDPDLQRHRSHSRWATRLLEALESDNFVLHAQRIVPLQGRSAAIHAEVLVRLRDHDGQLLPPGVFMPSVERFQLAPQLDRWVLRHTLDWLRDCGPAADKIGLLAVNLSGQSVADRAFHHELDSILAASDIDPAKLCFEITETTAISDLPMAGRFLAGLRARGYRVALDDLGGGFTSLDYLRALPIDLLKIDGKMVQAMTRDPLDRAMLRCIQEIAGALGQQTVAEWVEQPAQRDMLRALGVDYGQGFLFHKPAPLADLLRSVPGALQA